MKETVEKCYAELFEVLRCFLSNPTTENKKLAVTIIIRDSERFRDKQLSGGMSPISSAEKAGAFLENLQKGDKQTWTWTFAMLRDSQHDFTIMKALSPFKDQTLIVVDYGCGFVSLHGDIQPLLDSIIHGDNNMKIYDADKYLVALPKIVAAGSEVHWQGCGASGPGIPEDRPRLAHSTSMTRTLVDAIEEES